MDVIIERWHRTRAAAAELNLELDAAVTTPPTEHDEGLRGALKRATFASDEDRAIIDDVLAAHVIAPDGKSRRWLTDDMEATIHG